MLAVWLALGGENPNSCSEFADGGMWVMPVAQTANALVIASPSLSSSGAAGPSELPVSKRLFGVIPNYRADQYTAQYVPIATAGKFAIARSDSFDWPNYFLLAGYALQAQVAAGGFKHSGGLSAFGRYYSRSVADQIVGAYVTEAILPTLWHEDPRFFRLGSGTVMHRAYYAASRIFVVKHDDGHTGIYLSELLGNMGVTAFGAIYYTNSRTAPASLERYGMALGNDMISNWLTEFWPDIRRKLPVLHKH
jgi:hypothetical protein